MKMKQTECSETSACKIQTPGNYPEENIQKLLYGFNEKDRYLSTKDAAMDRTFCRTSFEWSMDLSHDRLHSEWIGEEIQPTST
jgi:hypothetical protein